VAQGGEEAVGGGDAEAWRWEARAMGRAEVVGETGERMAEEGHSRRRCNRHGARRGDKAGDSKPE
jgi:hypothetical protein